MKAVASSEPYTHLATKEPRSRGFLFHLGQPFYGWLRNLVSLLQPVSTGLGHQLSEVVIGSSHEAKPVKTGSAWLDEILLDQP